VASTWSALRRRAPTPRPKYPASARRLRRGSSGEEPASDVVCAHDVERRLADSQDAEERLLKSSEMDDRWCRLWREPRSIVSELAPDSAGIDAVPHHRLGDTCDSSNGWWNLLAPRKRDEVRARVRDRRTRPSPRDLEEMSARSGSRGLAVNHQHLELRERQHGRIADHHSQRLGGFTTANAAASRRHVNSCFNLRFFSVSSGLTATPSHQR
jgi:hypothetical protein